MSDSTYIDRHGAPLTLAQWIAVCRVGGIGMVLADTVVPTPAGHDVQIRTMWFGIVIPELDVRAFGTGCCAGGNIWQDMEQYDTEADALAGHTRWVENFSDFRDFSGAAQ